MTTSSHPECGVDAESIGRPYKCGKPGCPTCSQQPSFVVKVWDFRKARARWKAAGKPKRSPERIAELFAICESCPMFNGNGCRLCGCRLKSKGAFLNKLAWSTESCPAEPPKWTAEAENRTPEATPNEREGPGRYDSSSVLAMR
jgi:hypothetical protein